MWIDELHQPRYATRFERPSTLVAATMPAASGFHVHPEPASATPATMIRNITVRMRPPYYLVPAIVLSVATPVCLHLAHALYRE